ncbi:methyltransferase [Stenotrophomonas phage vB_SmaS-DLP_6]|nr:methyltransferase [Stenotrophomonas phage vB_SmaS-DLP_6]
MTEMTKEQLLKAYQGLHDGSASYRVGDKLARDESGYLFDGSNFYEKLWTHFKEWASTRDSFRLLDYGCGKAKHLYQPHLEKKTFHQYFGGKVQEYYCYDPGNKKFEKPPVQTAKFDVVICADVMEHVLESDVDQTLLEISNWLAPDGIAMFSISGDVAKKKFADGTNLHVCVKDFQWWRAKLNAMGRRYVCVYTAGNNVILAKKV